MKIEIDVNIKGIEPLAEALTLVATALGKSTVQSVGPVAKFEGGLIKENPVLEKEEKPAEKTLTNAQKQKNKISAEIVELGGTPPTKGSVAVFQDALAKLKDSAAKQAADDVKDLAGDTNADVDDDLLGDEPESTPDEATDSPMDKPATPPEMCTLDNVRTLATAMMRSCGDNDDGKALGRTKLKACLAKVGDPGRLTACNERQLINIVPLLEENLGKTMAEVLAETSD